MTKRRKLTAYGQYCFQPPRGSDATRHLYVTTCSEQAGVPRDIAQRFFQETFEGFESIHQLQTKSHIYVSFHTEANTVSAESGHA